MNTPLPRWVDLALIPALLVAATIFAAPAQAQSPSARLVRGEVKELAVVVQDEAIGGCWTNIEAARGHLTEKLEARGFEIVEAQGAQVWAQLMVSANRIDGAGCFGMAAVRVWAWSETMAFGDAVPGQLAEYFLTSANKDSGDATALNVIDRMMTDLGGAN